MMATMMANNGNNNGNNDGNNDGNNGTNDGLIPLLDLLLVPLDQILEDQAIHPR